MIFRTSKIIFKKTFQYWFICCDSKEIRLNSLNRQINQLLKSLQCGEKNCWCAFLDAGYRIQSIPFVGRNESSVCPKLYMFGKDPCRVTPEPLVNCQNARSPKMKWIYDKLQKQCIYIQSCSGFPSELDCASTCGKNFF